jgi:hypothetical protein
VSALPATRGRWSPIVKGRTAPRVVAYIEVFRTRGDAWVTIPGTSRFVEVSK